MPRIHNLNTYSDVSRAATGEPLLSRNSGRLYRQDRTHLAGWNFYYWQGSLSCNPLEGLVQAEGGGSNLSQGEGYEVMPGAGKRELNHQRFIRSSGLFNGDVLRVSGITFQFKLKLSDQE